MNAVSSRGAATSVAIIVGAAMLALSIFAGFAAGPAAAAQPKCTIKGTKGPDRLVGTAKRDVICGFGGKDVLVGKGGKDHLVGGKGDDKLRGGRGGDLLSGGPANDRLYGEPQNDTLLGGPGDDYLNGGSGNNTINGGPGQNRCLAGAADTLAGTCDNTGPRIVEVSITPGSVDTWEQSRTIEVTYRVADDLTGLQMNSQHLGARHAASGQTAYSFPTLVSGDEKDATFAATIRLPRYAAQGRWDLDIQSRDKAGNFARSGPAELAALGLPNGFDQTGRGDSGKPQVLSLAIDRSSVDSSGADQTINATVRVTDDMTGINMENTNGVGMVAYHRGHHQFNDGPCTRTSGTSLDGIYHCQIMIRRYSAPGEWELRVGARDHAGNETVLSPYDLRDRGLPWRVDQTGPGDTQAPKLTELQVTPSHIDTTSAPAAVNFRMRLTDDLSGLAWFDNYSVVLYSNGVQSPITVDMTRIWGGPLDSVYEGSVTMPQGSVHGSWSPNVVLADVANNVKFLYPSDLTALGLTTGFTNGP